MSVTNDQSPNRKTALDPLFWTIAAAIAGAIVFVCLHALHVRGTSLAVYSKPFAFRTAWAGGEERNVTSALAASA